MDIEVYRPKQFQDRVRRYELFADDKKLIEIKAGSTQTVHIPESTKFLQARIDWCSSPKFYVSNIESNKITIKSTFGGNIFTALCYPLYYITLGKDKYLTIESGL